MTKVKLDIHIQKWNFDPYLKLYIYEINSKSIINLNVKPKIVKLHEITRENLCDSGLGMDFLDMTQNVPYINKKI